MCKHREFIYFGGWQWDRGAVLDLPAAQPRIPIGSCSNQMLWQIPAAAPALFAAEEYISSCFSWLVGLAVAEEDASYVSKTCQLLL